MKIKFSLPKGTRVVGVDEKAFNMIGLYKLFSGYSIIATNQEKWTSYLPRGYVDLITNDNKRIEILNAISKLHKKSVKKEQKVHVLTFQSEKKEAKLCKKYGFKYLNNSSKLRSKIENKYWIRTNFLNPKLFPKFELKKFSRIKSYRKFYKEMTKKFGKFVVQHENLAGGEGTFIIENYEECLIAMKFLKKINSRRIVISKYINGIHASIQAVVTKDNLVSTGIQQQIVGERLLTNSLKIGSESFCGGVFGYLNLSKKTLNQARDILQELELFLRRNKYKGIFGIDIIITRSKIYLLEINPRMTGMTPVIAMLQKEKKEIPLILLHLLELGKFDYKITEKRIDKYFLTKRKASYMILHNRFLKPFEIKGILKDGVYKMRQGKIKFLRTGFQLSDITNSDEFLILQTPKVGAELKPGERLAKVIMRKNIFKEKKMLKMMIKSIEEFLQLEKE